MKWLDYKLRRFKFYRRWRGLPEPMREPFITITRETMRIALEKMAKANGRSK